MSDQPQRLYLIDGSSYIYRAYYAIRHLSNSKGLATNAVFGFVNMLLKVVREQQPDHLAVIFDAPGPTFRKELYPEYKSNRAKMPDDLVPQVPLIKEVVRAFNMPAIEKEGFEADDIIATLAKRFAGKGLEVTVVTGDKDLLQIVSERIRLLDTMKAKVSGLDEVAERFGGEPAKVIEVQALAGDTSDNVPGVPGVGEKTAVKLIQEYGSVENLLASVDQLKGKLQERLREYGELARLSRQLVTLRDDVPLELDYAAFALSAPDSAALTALFRELEFHKLLQEFSCDEQATGEGYRAVLAEAELEALAAALQGAERFAFDTETTSLDATRADLVGLSFAVKPGEGWYIPLAHRYLGAPEQLDPALVLERLRPLLTDPARSKIAQNAKYDLLVLRRAGLDPAAVVDVLSQGTAQSWQMENRWQTMVEGKFDFGFAVEWMREDLRICLEEARRNGAELPVAALVDRFYAEVEAMGGRRWAVEPDRAPESRRRRDSPPEPGVIGPACSVRTASTAARPAGGGTVPLGI